MREDLELCDFSAGELSPKLKGRTDYERYFSGLDTELNMVSLPQGGATRRPGTLLAGLAKDQTNTPFFTRMLRFVFSGTQAYMLELSSGNVRIYANDGVVLNGGVPVDVAWPYVTSELAALQFVQSADTLFICHPSHPLATLTRSSNTNWTFTASALRDGPYLDVNITATTLTPSGTTGSITITASSVVGINVTPTSTGQGFLPTDVGRFLRIRLFSLWAWCIITAVADTLHVTATVQPAVLNAGAYGAIDGAPWAANTRYPTGAVVLANGSYYIALTGGVSGGPNGPAGLGGNIVDGTVTWSVTGPFNAVAFAQQTIYACGDVVFAPGSGNYYVCTTGGTSGGSASEPTGTGINITPPDTTAIFEYVAPFVFPTSTIYWQLGKFSATTGYPQIPTFWQQRLALLGTNNQPNAVEGSVSADFTNFAPTQQDGTVVANNALSWVIGDDQVNAVRWVSPAGSSVAMQLGIGTTDGEQVMQPATNSLALSPTNVQVYRETSIGAAPNVPATRIGKSVLFFNRAGRKLMDWVWQWAINGYLALDRTVDSDHITRSVPANLPGVVMDAYQQQPYGIVWCVRGDGQLIGYTYLPDQKISAWHRHQLGGQYYGGPPIVESVATIPSPDGTYDEIWFSVLRTIAGVPTRTIEVMTRFFDGLPQEESFFVDCGISSALTFPNATLTPSALSGTGIVFAANAPVFSAGSVGSLIRINNGVAIIRTYTDSEHVIADYYYPATNAQPQAANAWSCTPQYTSFSGIPELNGETVQILGDGADLQTAVVVAGGFPLPSGQSASYAIAGLPSTYDLVTMPWEPKRAMPVPPGGKTKIIDHLFLRLHETLGCSYGRLLTDVRTNQQIEKLRPLQMRYAVDPMGLPPPLFSGIQKLPAQGGFDMEGQIEITGSGPFPCTVLSIGASADVGAS